MKAINRITPHRLSHFMAIMLAILLWACTPTTRITGTWKSPEAMNNQYKKIAVAALTDNARAREKVENDMQAQLQMRGVTVAKSIDMFPPSMASKNGPDVNLLMDKLKNEGFDGIMTVALIDEKTETRFVPGNFNYAPISRFGWYGRFRGYYTYWYPTLYDPGYYTEEKVYFLETNLYDGDSENLVWSAQSQSYSPASLRKASEKLAEITVNELAQTGLIR